MVEHISDVFWLQVEHGSFQKVFSRWFSLTVVLKGMLSNIHEEDQIRSVQIERQRSPSTDE